MNAHSTIPAERTCASPRPRRDGAQYPGKVAIKHVVAAAKGAGIDVAGVEVSPDGTIRVVEARALPTAPASLFDQLEQAGKL